MYPCKPMTACSKRTAVFFTVNLFYILLQARWLAVVKAEKKKYLCAHFKQVYCKLLEKPMLFWPFSRKIIRIIWDLPMF